MLTLIAFGTGRSDGLLVYDRGYGSVCPPNQRNQSYKAINESK